MIAVLFSRSFFSPLLLLVFFLACRRLRGLHSPCRCPSCLSTGLPQGPPRPPLGGKMYILCNKANDFAMTPVFQKWPLRVPLGPPKAALRPPQGSPKGAPEPPKGSPRSSWGSPCPPKGPPKTPQEHHRPPQATQGTPRSPQGRPKTTPRLPKAHPWIPRDPRACP